MLRCEKSVVNVVSLVKISKEQKADGLIATSKQGSTKAAHRALQCTSSGASWNEVHLTFILPPSVATGE